MADRLKITEKIIQFRFYQKQKLLTVSFIELPKINQIDKHQKERSLTFSMQYIIDPEWKWAECHLVIRRVSHVPEETGQYESLQSEIDLEDEAIDPATLDPEIVMERNFEFEESTGFIWHKSWNIPEMQIRLSQNLLKALGDEPQKKIYCEMLSAHPLKKDDHYYLEEVKIEGQTRKPFNKRGEVKFINTKFSETTFNKSKNKFSLVLAMYFLSDNGEKTIIKSYVSSPIHVDSRKQARKKVTAINFIHDEVAPMKFLEPLEGSEKLLSEGYSEESLLTINGFIKYYTSANIRSKIKHPYYIGYIFHKIFDVYYNSEYATDALNVLELIYESEKSERGPSKQAKPKLKKKDLIEQNKEILKKKAPSYLIFMIKNTPKKSYIIKEQSQAVGDQENPDSIKGREICQSKQSNQDYRGSEKEEQARKQALFFDRETFEVRPKKQSNIIVRQTLDDQKKFCEQLFQSNQKCSKAALANEEDLSEEECILKIEENSDNVQEFNGSNQESLKDEIAKEEEAIKKIQSIFQSWKFGFITLKKSDGGLTVLNKKWIPVPRHELYSSFKTFKHKNQSALNSLNSRNKPSETAQSAKDIQKYELHQIIDLQVCKRLRKQKNLVSENQPVGTVSVGSQSVQK